MSRCLGLLWVLVCAIAVSSPGFADITRRVPLDNLTITEALEVSGVTRILVAPDHIEETGTIQLVTGVSLEVDPDPFLATGNVPEINAGGDAFGVRFPTNASGTRIVGFKISNFTFVGVESDGFALSTPLEIRDCTIDCDIEDSEAFAYQGIQVLSGHAIVTGCLIKNAGFYGIAVNSDDGSSNYQFTLETNIIVNSGQDAIYVLASADDVIIRNNTIYKTWASGNGTGINIGITTNEDEDPLIGSALIEKNIVTACYYGIACFGQQVITLRYNNIVSNVVNNRNNLCNLAENISQTPIGFRDPENGDFTLHVNSRCYPSHNAFTNFPNGVLIGAKGVSVASGAMLFDNTVLDPEYLDKGQVLVTSDVRVGKLGPLGAYSAQYLTLNAGTVLKFDDSDESNLGLDSGKNELVVKAGSLLVNGTSELPVQLMGATGSGESEWAGILMDDSDLEAESFIQYADVENASYGIVILSEGSNVVDHCTLSHNGSRDIYVGFVDAPDIEIAFNVIDVGSGTGIEAQSATSIHDNEVTGTLESTAGIELDSPDASATSVYRNTVSGFGNGFAFGNTGAGAAPTLQENVFTASKWGAYVTQGAPIIGSSEGGNAISSNSYGVYVKCAGSSLCPPACTAAPVLRFNTFSANDIAIVSQKTSNVDAGLDDDYGYNRFQGFYDQYCIWNNSDASCGWMSMYGNYWYDDCVEPTCTFGLVAGTDFFLCDEEGRALNTAVAMAPVVEAFTMRCVPNPCRAATTVRVANPSKSSGMTVDIHDVSGRLVRRLHTGALPAGDRLDLVWDGRTTQGSSVPSGLYFIVARDGVRTVGNTKLFVTR